MSLELRPSISTLSTIKRALKPSSGKLAAILFATPLWKLVWQGIDAYGNIRMITDNLRQILSFLGSWPGAIVLMLVGFVLLWVQIRKQTTQPDAAESGLKASDSNSRVYMSPEEKQSLLDERRTANENYLKIKEQHEDCPTTIKGLESTISRLRRNEQDYGVEITGNQTQIDQLQATIDGLEWLRRIADEQGQTIHRFVPVTAFRIGRFELFQRNDPFIEFTLVMENHSVHNVCLSEVAGPIEFHGRELTGTLQWREPATRILTWSTDGVFSFRQNLTGDDVTYIMNHPEQHFGFASLDIQVKGFGNSESSVVPQPLPLGARWLNNNVLIDRYPKLSITVVNLTATFIVNLFDWGVSGQDSIVTILAALKNPRHDAMVIDSISLTVTIDNQPYVAAAEFGGIWEKKFIDKQGELQTSGKQLSNLADRLPLRIVQAEVSGSLQFLFRGLGAKVIATNIPYELLLTDDRGEKHPYTGTINRQSAVED